MACGIISVEIAGDMFPCGLNLQSWGSKPPSQKLGGTLVPPDHLFLPLQMDGWMDKLVDIYLDIQNKQSDKRTRYYILKMI